MNSWPVGFDFRGTLWEPARSAPGRCRVSTRSRRATRCSIREPGQPPTARHRGVRAAHAAPRRARVVALVLSSLGACVCTRPCGSSRVRDWRCPRPRAHDTCGRLHGLYYGNVTDRHARSPRARVALSRSGGDRGRVGRGCSRSEVVRVAPCRLAAADARGSALRRGLVGSGRSPVARVVGADRVRGVPRLPRAPPRRAGRYAERASPSRPSPVQSGVRSAPPSRSPRRARLHRGGRVARPRENGDRRALPCFAASMLASPIVWPNYWRCSSSRGGDMAELRADLVLRVRDLAPRRDLAVADRLEGPRRRRPDVPEQAWACKSHTEPVLWYGALGTSLVMVAVAALLLVLSRGPVPPSRK